MQLQNLSIIISGPHEVEVEFKFHKCNIDQQFSQNCFLIVNRFWSSGYQKGNETTNTSKAPKSGNYSSCKILVAIFATSWQTLPCWNCSSTICRLARDSAYCFTWSWEMVSCSTVSSLCLETRFNCSCKDSTCRLAWWLNENKIHYLNNRSYHSEN